MKKLFYSIVLLITITLINYQSIAQTAVDDSITMTPGYAEDVFYSLENGTVLSVVRANWDIAFYTSSMSSGIITNGGSGILLYAYPKADTSGWATVDTGGISNWTELNNSEEIWEEGAFGQNETGHPDYGWGVYNTVTHNLTGDSLFIIKLINGTYKKIWIVEKQSAANIYTFRYANVDGSNDTTISLDCSQYPDKNFVYYSIENNTTLDREPLADSWDFVFTKYTATQPSGGFYNVTGVLTNNEVGIIRRDSVDASITSWEGVPFEDNISTIGFNWKYFDMGTFKYVVDDSLVFFVKNLDGNVYKLTFTGFAGSSTGNAYFTKQLLSLSDVEDIMSLNDINVFPNPATDNFFINIDMNIDQNAKVQVIDMHGKVVYSADIEDKSNLLKIYTGTWNSGLYLVSVQTGNQIISKKVLVNRN